MLTNKMKLLAIDTSTNICNVCITEEGKVVAEYLSGSTVTHTERLMPAIQSLFLELDWRINDLDGIAVVNGPGSFTGLRIGLSVAKGLLYALGIPVVAANALEVAAYQIQDEGWICPAMDARRGEIFTSLFYRSGADLVQRTEPRSISPQAWHSELPAEPIRFCGPGAQLYFDSLKNHADSTLLFGDFVLARTLALLAQEKFRRGDVLQGDDLRAAYLRPSDAEVKAQKKT